MTEDERFANGFIEKCAEMGVDPWHTSEFISESWGGRRATEVVRSALMKKEGGWKDMVSWIPKMFRGAAPAAKAVVPAAAHEAQAAPGIGQGLKGFAGSLARPAEGAAPAGARPLFGQGGHLWNTTPANAPKGFMGHAGNVATTIGGAGMGNMTADDMAPGTSARLWQSYDPKTGEPIKGSGVAFNPLGMAAGAFVGNRYTRGTAAGQTMKRPAFRAMYGGALGSGVDMTAGLANVDTGGRFGQAGAWGGLASGLGSNRFLSRKEQLVNKLRGNVLDARTSARNLVSTPLKQGGGEFGRRAMLTPEATAQAKAEMDALNRSFAGRMHGAGNVIDQSWHGAFDPILGAGRKVRNFMVGPPRATLPAGGEARTSAILAQLGQGGVAHAPTQGTGLLGRRLGQLGFAVPTVGGLGLGAYGLATNKMDEAVNQKATQLYEAGREQASGDVTDFMHQRGFLNEHGQFDPAQATMRGLGNQFSGAGNQFMQMLGMGNRTPEGYPAGWVGPQSGQMAAHRPGMYNMGAVNNPMGRNELAAQQKQPEQPTGQGWL